MDLISSMAAHGGMTNCAARGGCDSDTGKSDIALCLKSEECVYTKCYCEENVWKLCERISQEAPAEVTSCYATFISNDGKKVPIWQQRASSSVTAPVIWDYHVILVYRAGKDVYVYDQDTRLPFPCLFSEYIQKALGSEMGIDFQFHRMFRVVPAKVFLQKFASDRSHMLSKEEWVSPPPRYPCIKISESSNNIADFISMDPSVGYGEVMNQTQLLTTFANKDLHLYSLISNS